MQQSFFDQDATQPEPGAPLSFGQYKKSILNIEGFSLLLIESLLDEDQALSLLNTWQQELPWEQPSIRIAGKTIPIPRKQVWMGDNGVTYTYSGMPFTAQAWHPQVHALKELVSKICDTPFNSVLCNYYRHGQDSVSWHADDEPELGDAPVIASYSLGATRDFQLRRSRERTLHSHVPLPHNSLLLMPAGFQAHWQHQIAKTRRVDTPRLNFTFRQCYPLSEP